ncbi:MAG TPA: serine--tRNA ligase [Thermomicrobiales bacterium]|nr:serine--tRNA ligase [Thermomicrobiales bacterium]
MIDIRIIRERPDEVKHALDLLNTSAPIDRIIELDAERRRLVTEVDQLKATRNEGSKAVSKAKDPDERNRLIAEMKQVSDAITVMDAQITAVDGEFNDLMLQVPNMPMPEVPVGKDDSENVVVRTVGEIREREFAVKPHWETGVDLGIIDFERGVKIAGSRMYVLKGLGARLQRAIITWMLDLHIKKHGYSEIYPPYLVTSETLVGTGNLPKFGDNLFKDHLEDRWLIPTAEVPVTNLYRDEILDETQLPIYHVAYTPCFRREQLSAGRDVRGIKRGYQFDKVEMVKFVHPDQSSAEHERLTQEAADVLEALDLPYRVVQMCTGDLSFTAANKVDIEVWAPGSQEWLEVSSCSNFRDFQARRANLRFRPEAGGRPQYLHTLNGSGLALPRTMIAIMENYQNPDGSFDIPDVLLPYMDGVTRISGA